MFASSMRVPVARSWSGVSPLTVACVPTGMNAGVSTEPCGVSSRPDAGRRARVDDLSREPNRRRDAVRPRPECMWSSRRVPKLPRPASEADPQEPRWLVRPRFSPC